MKKQFATYEIALKLKELGFDEECFGVYYDYKGNYKLCFDSLFSNKDIIIHTDEHSYYTLCLAPLWQQAIDWLREKHDIDVEIHASFGNGGWWWANLCYNPTRTEVLNIKKFENYYEAREQAILKAIELCKNN